MANRKRAKQRTEPFDQIVPPELRRSWSSIHGLHMKIYADAIDRDRFALMLMLTPDTIERLHRGETDLLELENGGVVLLVSQATAEAHYGEGDGHG